MKAREQLSLLNMEGWIPGRGSHAKACGVKNFLDPTGEFGPRVCRVFYSGPDELSSEFRVREVFILDPFHWFEGKNVCVTNQKFVALNNL